jgi:serine/threonine protein kinase
MSTPRPKDACSTWSHADAAWSDVSGIHARARDWRGAVLPGGLHVERVIGTGAVGVVLSAIDARTGLRVAVKMLSGNSALDHDQRVRLRREARALQRLTSQHTARLYDFRELDDGTPIIVMEYLHGCTLQDVIVQSGPLPVPAAVKYILHVLDALAEAHALGLIHRDIKPSNLFLVWQNGAPVVKLLDFGLVKDIIATKGTVRLTRTGFMLGTPAYMSPEQLDPKRPADPRADVWAVAVTLYELLTGHLPFDAPTIPLLVTRVMNDNYTPLRPVRKDVSPRLERIIAACLEKDPERRFPSAAALALALSTEV